MGKCMWMSAIAGGVLAMTSVSTAESNIVNDQAGSVTAAGIKIVKEIGKASADPRLKHFGLAKMPPAPEDGFGNAAFLSGTGPIATKSELGVDSNQVSDLVTCGVCTSGATAAVETALPTLWTQWGDAFFNRADAIAGKWMQDQGCFIITACAGNVNPANRFPMPVSFNYTSSLVPNGRVCGFLSNFDAPNDAANAAGISLFDVPTNGGGPTLLPTNPAGCTPYDTTPPALTANQRDQDALEIIVPAGGIQDFRLYATAAQEFETIFYVNKAFPEPGDINSCWTDPNDTNTPPQEHGWIANAAGGLSATNPNTPAASKGPEGAPNTTWAWPRAGTTFLPQGTYHIFMRLKTFGNLTPPSVPTPPTTQYQVQIIGSLGTGTPTGACCLVTTGACSDNTLSFNCEKLTASGGLGGVYRGDGTTCSAINSGTVPCNITPFTSNEGTNRDGCTTASSANDQNQGCVGTAPPFTLFADALSSGQIIQGFSGAELGTNFNTFVADDDWYTYETVAQENVKFTLDAEFPAVFQIFFADAASADPCAEGVGYGFSLGNAVRDVVLEACVPAGTLVLTRVTPNGVPYPCGNPAGPTYTLELTTGTCNSVACCTLAGSCSNISGPACFAAGGISYGEGTTCATSTCCSGASVCTGSNVTENALTRFGGLPGSGDLCVNAGTFGQADNWNGGCDDGNTSNGFSIINPGQRVCATTSAFDFQGDNDWYRLTVPAGIDSYAGVAIRSQVPLTAGIYTQPIGVTCPPTRAELNDRRFAASGVAPCDTDLVILGDCSVAGSVLYVSVELGLLEYDLPCNGTTPAAQYYIEYITGPCTGTAVTCSGTNENETLCQAGNLNPGCNADTPVFGTIACNQTICGTGDLIGGIRDLDWYQISHPGGNLGIQFTSAFYGQVTVLKPGTQGPSGCDDLTVVDGRAFVRPNTATTFTINALAAGTYWIVVGPDFDGTKRVCCSSSSNYSVRPSCTPPSCKGDLNNDTLRNTTDLVAFLAVFGSTVPPANPNADFNNDNAINTTDLVAFLGVFGVPCP